MRANDGKGKWGPGGPGVGDTIDFTSLAFSSGNMSYDKTTFGALDGTLTVENGSTSAAVYLSGNYTSTAGTFEFKSDGASGADVTWVPTTAAKA